MIKKICSKTLFRVLVVAAFLSASVLTATAGVDIYAEGAYTDSDLAVYIYADITDDAICSAGVKLTYDSSKVTFVSAEKNEDVWFMGDGTVAGNNDYMDPEHDGINHTVIVICGKLDTAAPTTGVIDERVLLGKVFFTINSAPITTPVPSPEESFFGISLDLGRVAPYVNFATTTGTDLDSGVTTSSITIKERGDANADRNINVADYIAIRNNINSNNFPPYMDCNDDKAVNVADYICVRNKF